MAYRKRKESVHADARQPASNTKKDVERTRSKVAADGNRRPVDRLGLAREINRRKRAEEALQESGARLAAAQRLLTEAERKYRDILEKVEEGVFQTTPEGTFLTANPALARMLGFDSTEELINSRTDIAQEHYVDPQKREE